MPQVGSTRNKVTTLFSASHGLAQMNNSAVRKVIPFAISQYRLHFANDNRTNGAVTAVPITVEASATFDGDATTAELFSAAASVSIPVGGRAVTDWVSKTTAGRRVIDIACFADAGAGNLLPMNHLLVNAFGDRFEKGTALTNKKMSPTTIPMAQNDGGNDNEIKYALNLIAIEVVPVGAAEPVVLTIGDSNNSFPNSFPGWAMLMQDVAYGMFGNGGTSIHTPLSVGVTADNDATNLSFTRWAQTSNGNYYLNTLFAGARIIDEYAVNDLYAGTLPDDYFNAQITHYTNHLAGRSIVRTTLMTVVNAATNGDSTSNSGIPISQRVIALNSRFKKDAVALLPGCYLVWDVNGNGERGSNPGLVATVDASALRPELLGDVGDGLHLGYHATGLIAASAPIENIVPGRTDKKGPVLINGIVAADGSYLDILIGEHRGKLLTPTTGITGLTYTAAGTAGKTFSGVDLLYDGLVFGRYLRCYTNETILKDQTVSVQLGASNLRDPAGNAPALLEYETSVSVVNSSTVVSEANAPASLIEAFNDPFTRTTALDAAANNTTIGNGIVDQYGNSGNCNGTQLVVHYPGTGGYRPVYNGTVGDVLNGEQSMEFTLAEINYPASAIYIGWRYNPATGAGYRLRVGEFGGLLGVAVNTGTFDRDLPQVAVPVTTDRLKLTMKVGTNAQGNTTIGMVLRNLTTAVDLIPDTRADYVDLVSGAPEGPQVAGKAFVAFGEQVAASGKVDNWIVSTSGADTTPPTLDTGAGVRTSKDGSVVYFDAVEANSKPVLPVNSTGANGLSIGGIIRSIVNVARRGSRGWRARLSERVLTGQTGITLGYDPAAAGSALTDSATTPNELTAFTAAAVTNNSLVPDPSTVTGVTVSPAAITLAGGAVQIFSASVAGENNPSQAVTWSKVGAGTLTAAGQFTAPAATFEIQTITIKATSDRDPAFSGTATVTVSALPPGTSFVTGVAITPSAPVAVYGGDRIDFSSIVAGTGDFNPAVEWTCTIGQIDANGVWTAPAATGLLQTGTVTATSVQDRFQSAPATVSVYAWYVPGNVATPVTGTSTVRRMDLRMLVYLLLGEHNNSLSAGLPTGDSAAYTLASNDRVNDLLRQGARHVAQTCYAHQGQGNAVFSGRTFPIKNIVPAVTGEQCWAVTAVRYGSKRLKFTGRAQLEMFVGGDLDLAAPVPGRWYPEGSELIGVYPKPANLVAFGFSGLFIPAPCATDESVTSWLAGGEAEILAYYAAAVVAMQNLHIDKFAQRADRLEAEYLKRAKEMWTRIERGARDWHYPIERLGLPVQQPRKR